MDNRLSRCIAAGLLSAGLSTGMLLGCGYAAATPDADAADPAASQTAPPREKAARADKESTEVSAGADPGAVEASDPDGGDPGPDADAEADAELSDDEEASSEATGTTRRRTDKAHKTEYATGDVRHSAEPAVDTDAAIEPDEPSAEPVAPVVTLNASTQSPVGSIRPAPRTKADPETSTIALVDGDRTSIVESSPPARPTLINVIGSVVFGFIDLASKIIAGPATVPRNSTVRVARSTVEIDCGGGYIAGADWYVPTAPEPVKGLIVLQHGFAARGGFYNATAAALAESTNSIVLTPTITSNFFACDSCHLTGDPMHFAVAELFSGDRAALNASLHAAFPGEDIGLPQKYVLIGHSGGSQLVTGAAGFASQLAGPGGSPDLAGLILFETNDIGDFLSRGIAKIPLATPVYYVGGDPALLNNFDEVHGLVNELRPGSFTGLLLDGGTHIDIMSGTNPLTQIGASILLGFPTQENAAAARLLATGWINDMLTDGPNTGVYAEPAQTIQIATEMGVAQAVSLGGPVHEKSAFESLMSFAFGLFNNLRFGYCAADVDELLSQHLNASQSVLVTSESRRTHSCGAA